MTTTLDTSLVDEIVSLVKKTGVYTFDIEHDGDLVPTSKDFELWGVSIAVDTQTYWIRNKELGSVLMQTLFALESTDDGREIEHVAFNGKYDLKCLMIAGWITKYPKLFCDPMVAINLLDDSLRPNEMGLKATVKRRYGHEMLEYKVTSVAGPDSALFKKYATDDATWELKVWLEDRDKLKKENLWRLFTNILMPAAKIFADMERIGILWDTVEARRLILGFGALRDTYQVDVIKEIGYLNLNSGDQLSKRLFDELGYSTRGIEMTKTGKRFSTDEAAMTTLARKYPVCKKIVSYRTANKMLNTYVMPLTQAAMDDPKGRIHPTVWLVSTTGRTRQEKPNFQNIPAFLDELFKGLTIRNCVIPAAGRKLIVADLSQIELRICGHLSQDPVFLKAYRDWTCTCCGETGSSESQILHKCPKCGAAENEDILKSCPKCKRLHMKADKTTKDCAVCRDGVDYDEAKIKGFWHGLDLHQITTDSVSALKGNRQHGKTANFALIYLATGTRLHDEYPDLSVAEWEDVRKEYFEKYLGVRRWHILMEGRMTDTGICVDTFGRRRRILKKDIRMSYKHALNQFVNFPVQASACNLILLSLVKIVEELVARGWWLTKVFFNNFVHDELVFEVDDDIIPEVNAIIIDKMENTVRFRVPIRTDLKVVTAWGHAKG